jgi:DNA-binding NtrC family response regulator
MQPANSIEPDEGLPFGVAKGVCKSNFEVLVVEDDRALRELLSFKLEREGYRVACVSSGEEALEILEKREFHLVITDLFMRKVGGLSVLKRTKEINMGTKVIVVTGNPDMSLALEAFCFRADDFILKPFSLEEFSMRVATCLKT